MGEQMMDMKVGKGLCWLSVCWCVTKMFLWGGLLLAVVCSIAFSSMQIIALLMYGFIIYAAPIVLLACLMVMLVVCVHHVAVSRDMLQHLDKSGQNFLWGMMMCIWGSTFICACMAVFGFDLVNTVGFDSFLLPVVWFVFMGYLVLCLAVVIVNHHWAGRGYRGCVNKNEPGRCTCCGYDVRETIGAGRSECPWCGVEVRDEAEAGSKSDGAIWLDP
ncbi:hypothetical protein KS4_33930 [Poriferisphaera corsica]|uniref:Uncharacterized protein n=1 Tax=Poriferisphaera corsica TaxID=2528020 RepID=A0A517YYK4_9BACT|nr:hypothetical protein [Poriferisphaera corsica]QDU35312.1 hypothetical protein KS4_33930 [Poriferisphaera corsica]